MLPLPVRNISGIFCPCAPARSLGDLERDAEEVREAVPIILCESSEILPPDLSGFILWRTELRDQATVSMPGQATPLYFEVFILFLSLLLK